MRRPKSPRASRIRFAPPAAPRANAGTLPSALMRRLPPLSGVPIEIRFTPGLRDRRGPVFGGSFLRERRIEFDCSRAELPRILAHELFHFVWFRLGNPARRSWESVLAGELAAGARGELGWSAEWRKRALTPARIRARHRCWREYCCESFCDTAAWLYSGIRRHPEFTLAGVFRERRRAWFAEAGARGPFSL
jgi:hypothetical protein